jgi:hypothetical protein
MYYHLKVPSQDLEFILWFDRSRTEYIIVFQRSADLLVRSTPYEDIANAAYVDQSLMTMSHRRVQQYLGQSKHNTLTGISHNRAVNTIKMIARKYRPFLLRLMPAIPESGET